MLDALNSDHSDEELLSAASKSQYNDISETASNSGHRTDSKQRNKLKMNSSSGSVYLPSYLNVLCNIKCCSSLMLQYNI